MVFVWFPYLNQHEVTLFFFSDCKNFNDPTFLVHISMDYLASTSQILKPFFPLRQSSCDGSKLGSSEPLKGWQREITFFLPNLLFLFNFDLIVWSGGSFTLFVERHELLPPTLMPSQKCSETTESAVHNLLLPYQARKSSSVISLLKSFWRNRCTMPWVFSQFSWAGGKQCPFL